MRFFSGKKTFGSMPRGALAALGILLVAGFLAAIGLAQIGSAADTTTTGTTSTRTTTTSTTTTGTTTTGTTNTGTTSTSTTPSNGCPSAPSGGGAVSVGDVQPPARLQVASFATVPSVIPGSFQTFIARIEITDTCGQPVQGATVYVTAVPYEQVSIQEGTTGSDGKVTLTFARARFFPASSRQGLFVFFVRVTRRGDPLLAGISTRRLVSVPVHL